MSEKDANIVATLHEIGTLIAGCDVNNPDDVRDALESISVHIAHLRNLIGVS